MVCFLGGGEEEEEEEGDSDASVAERLELFRSRPKTKQHCFYSFLCFSANEAASNNGDHPLSLSTLGDTAV